MIDQVSPNGKWEFDKEVSLSFENMLQRSIPQYEIMRETVCDIACSVLPVEKENLIVDLGTSRGEVISTIFKNRPASRYYGIECSEPMLLVAKERFQNNSNITILNYDLRNGLPSNLHNMNICLSVLTIQFIPIEYRQFIIQDIYNRLAVGGLFIFVEKVLGSNASVDHKMVNIYLNHKRKNGYTEEQITRKKMSLEGVLVPVTAKWNEELLKMAGFKSVDCFWRWMNFAGWIAEK